MTTSTRTDGTTTVSPAAWPSYDEQVRRLLDLDLAARAGVEERRVRAALAALREQAHAHEAAADPQGPTLPVLLVVGRDWLAPEAAMDEVVAKGRSGRVEMTPTTPADYRTIEEVEVPAAPAYLLLDVDTGPDLQDVRPEDALVELRRRGRTPLTIDEGVALILQVPTVLAERNAYSLLASRQPGTQRVPAIWTSFKAPRLGWCWDRNPHTWLGSASASGRVGPAS